MNSLKKICLFLLFLCVFGVWFNVNADVIPENSHRYTRCVKIENMHLVPKWYKLVMRVQTVWDDYFYVVNKWECLQWHYKFGTATPVLLNSTISIEEINKLLKEDKELAENRLWSETLWVFEPINVNGGYINNDVSSLTYMNAVYSFELSWDNYVLKPVSYESDEEWEVLVERWIIDEMEYQSNDARMINKIRLFWIAWILTVLIETIVLVLLVKIFWKKDELWNWKLVGAGILASTITLPILWFCLPYFFADYMVYVVFWEIFVTLLEVVIIKFILKIDWRKAIILSVACNLVSFVSWLFIL